MMELTHKVAVITGAGSGIGRALAIVFAQRGCHLALSDINLAGLEETERLVLDALGADVETSKLPSISLHKVDVANRSEVEAFASQVLAEHQHVDVVINNAGVQASGTVEDIDLADFEWLMQIDMWGVIYTCRAFLPLLRRQEQASLVNIASINSFMPFELGGPYNMAKSAVQGLSETLMLELEGTGIQVLSVHPGGIQTNIANNARNVDAKTAETFNKKLMTTPIQAANEIARAVEKRKAWLFVGKDAKFLQLLKRLSPSLALKTSRALMKNVNKG